jgi:hypothetical protein
MLAPPLRNLKDFIDRSNADGRLRQATSAKKAGKLFPRSVLAVLLFRHSGQAALEAQTRNPAARERANLSRTPKFDDVPEQIACRRRPVPGLRCAAPGMTKGNDRLAKRPDLATGPLGSTGAGEEIRTLDPNLGKVVLYH